MHSEFRNISARNILCRSPIRFMCIVIDAVFFLFYSRSCFQSWTHHSSTLEWTTPIPATLIRKTHYRRYLRNYSLLFGPYAVCGNAVRKWQMVWKNNYDLFTYYNQEIKKKDHILVFCSWCIRNVTHRKIW